MPKMRAWTLREPAPIDENPLVLTTPCYTKSRPYVRGSRLTTPAPGADDRGQMPNVFPFQLLLATFAGWVNRRQSLAIEYLVEENRVLIEQLGGKRVGLTDAQRRRLAAKGKALGRKLLTHVATIVTPDTIMRWHLKLIAAKWTYPSIELAGPES